MKWDKLRCLILRILGTHVPESGTCATVRNVQDTEMIDMVPILLVLLLILILFGFGFAVEVLWYIALAVLVLWLLGFFMRGTTAGGGRSRWYRW